MKNGRSIRLEQMCKAESDIAVAAASVLARATFVQKMQAMEETYGVKFPKGCSGLVKDAAAEFIKNTEKEDCLKFVKLILKRIMKCSVIYFFTCEKFKNRL